jgi:Family of unknown function (DUF5678)
VSKNADNRLEERSKELDTVLTSDFSFLIDTDRDLARRYAGSWVVILDGEVIGHSTSSSKLIRELKEKNIRGAVFQFVPEEEIAAEAQ